MIATIEYIPLFSTEEIKLTTYYHKSFGVVILTNIDWSSNKAEAISSTGQNVVVHHDDLYKLVVSPSPITPEIFKNGDEFFYYERNKESPKKDLVFKKDVWGIVATNTKQLITWDKIFKVGGFLTRTDYSLVFQKQTFQRQIEVKAYPETNEYFIVPEIDEFIHISSIKYDYEFFTKELYKQGYKLEKVDETV